jgi:dienelactone hydrolase
MTSRRIWIICLLLSLILAGCQMQSSGISSTSIPTIVSTEGISSTPTAITTPLPSGTKISLPIVESAPKITPSPERISVGGDVSGIREEIEASDGLKLVGTYYAPVDIPAPWPGVILLHMLGSDRSTWDAYATQLADAGFAVFALDMRGHGETGGEVDWDLAEIDLQRVWDYLSAKQDFDPDRMGIIGASIGANMALIGGADEPSARTVILLSPGLNYQGVETEAAMTTYGARPVLIAASQEDTYSADSSHKLEQLALGEVRLEMYEGAGHGTFMLENEPGLGGLIIEWLEKYLQ